MTRSPHRHLWDLDPDVTFLNHGSFGACPLDLQEVQADLRRRIDRQPVDFFVRQLPHLFDAAREKVGAFVNAEPEGIAFVPNATSGVNTVMKSLDLRPGDELLTTDQAYGACKHTLDFVAEKTGARVIVARLPYPVQSNDELVAPILEAATDRTRIAMIDHIASPTGLVFPIARIVRELDARGIDTLVDGAHAIGQIPLDLDAIGAAYYTTNAHKWLCTPRGAALLHVRRDRRDLVHPLITSHGRGAPPAQRFRAEFDWTGTDDPTAHLVIPHAIDWLDGLLEGGWSALYAALHQRAMEARRLLADALELEAPSPDSMQGALAALVLPPRTDDRRGDMLDPLSAHLWEAKRIEVPIFPWPAPPQRILRISAHLYNDRADYEHLATALLEARERSLPER